MTSLKKNHFFSIYKRRRSENNSATTRDNIRHNIYSLYKSTSINFANGDSRIAQKDVGVTNIYERLLIVCPLKTDENAMDSRFINKEHSAPNPGRDLNLISNMTIVFWVIIVLCLAFGFLGCFVNKFPSVLLVLIATLIGKFCIGINFGYEVIAVVVAIWLVSAIINKKVLPNLIKKLHEYSKGATRGTTIGSILGILLLLTTDSTAMTVVMAIIGFGVLPYALAFVFEYFSCKDVSAASKGALSAYTLYIANTILKVIAFSYALYAIVKI